MKRELTGSTVVTDETASDAGAPLGQVGPITKASVPMSSLFAMQSKDEELLGQPYPMASTVSSLVPHVSK